MVEAVLLRPQLVIRYTRVRVHKEFSEGIVDLALDHPSLDHREDGRRHLLQDPIDKLLRARAAIHRESVDRRADGAALKVLN